MPGVEKNGTTRRDFLKIVGVGGLGVASVYVIGCASSGATATETKTATVTAPGGTATTTKTATVTAPGGTATVTATQTVTATATGTTLAKAVGFLTFKAAYCGGCRTCMAVCSLYTEGAVWPEMSLTQIVTPVTELFNARGYVCLQCDAPECVPACPRAAINPDPKTGARVIDQTKCDGCVPINGGNALCRAACILYPNAPISYNNVTKKAKNCNLCGGDPLCVKMCPQSQDVTTGPNASGYIRPEKDRVRKFIKAPNTANMATEHARFLKEIRYDNWWTFDGRVGHYTLDKV